ncbi:hypothetical protein [Stutzerimonas stutzeri]|uniref:hypothetical protein n=1 Tax=Stutzerimonas stutzeri TaxID=316 RepID=UPI001145F65B|nr:hypothetical protein [Stutzerimonas stutzeri]
MKILLAVFIFSTAAHTAAWAETQSALKAHGGQVIFTDPEKGFWRSVYFLKNGNHYKLFPKEQAYFDASLPSDFSEDSRYLKIEKTIRGSIEGSALEEDYDRAYCAFVEMASGCIVRQETGSFCGGQWGEDNNDVWLWAGEEITIDQRNQNTASKNSGMEALAEINGDANWHLCH